MRVIVNGKAVVSEAQTVAELVEAYRDGAARVAVVLNERIVPRAEHATTRLAEGDRVELLAFAGGG